MTKREVALKKAIAALEKWSREEITKSALLDAIAKLQATKPAHKQLRN
jgi:benzoyl-CoA reductase/2-hydroxyglutaryl-CoA dehydratase subunit BcrC/BadD/HgdB